MALKPIVEKQFFASRYGVLGLEDPIRAQVSRLVQVHELQDQVGTLPAAVNERPRPDVGYPLHQRQIHPLLVSLSADGLCHCAAVDAIRPLRPQQLHDVLPRSAVAPPLRLCS